MIYYVVFTFKRDLMRNDEQTDQKTCKRVRTTRRLEANEVKKYHADRLVERPALTESVTVVGAPDSVM